jgi:hypothetical protein
VNGFQMQAETRECSHSGSALQRKCENRSEATAPPAEWPVKSTCLAPNCWMRRHTWVETSGRSASVLFRNPAWV